MTGYDLNRRQVLRALGASAMTLAAAPGFAWATTPPATGRIVVVGGGFGGATAAKYLRKLSQNQLEVTLIERGSEFISCPTSNEVLGGIRAYDSLRHSYESLRTKWGVKVVTASVTAIDPAARQVTTDNAGAFTYDRLVLSPGFDFNFAQMAGYDAAAQEKIFHAWKAGPQTLALRKQLEEMPDGGVFALNVPKSPYRCPPGPYERACMVAHYFKQHKPKSKVIILDANEKVQSKEKLFTGVWATDYPGIIEYQPNWNAVSVDAASKTLTSEFGDTQKADVLNILPPMRAADIAVAAGVVNVNGRWADVNWTTLESTAVPGIHVIGDALQAAPLMPKSGHMANQHGKAVAAAIVDLQAGRTPRPPVIANTCYSAVDGERSIHVDSVHRYDPEKKTLLVVPGSGGVSAAPSAQEGLYARAWAENIWQDTLG